MSNWKEYKLEDALECLIDYRGKTPKKTISGIPLITAKIVKKGKIETPTEFIAKENYKSWMVRGLPKVGDIVLTTEAPLGEVAQLDNSNVALAQRIVTLRGKKDLLDNDFLLYLLQSDFIQHQLEARSSGSTVKGIKQSELRKIILKFPSLDKQKKIALKIKILDKKIQLNTQINQTLEQIAKALFKSWFVDFDPVRAKVQALSDGLSPEQAELAAMQAITGKTPEELTALSQTQPDRYAELAKTAKAFPCEMVEVDGVEMPKGWNLKALSDLGQIICGKTPSKSNKEFYGNDVPFIKIPDMHNQVFITQTTDNLSVAGANSQSKKYIPPKSICVSCIATVGLVSMTSKPSHTNQQINSIIPNDEKTSEFLYLSLKQPSMTKYLKDLASGGSATLNLNTSTFSKIEIITPSKEIIDIFHNKVFYTFEKVLSNSIENKRLAKTRDLLLPRLLNGEI